MLYIRFLSVLLFAEEFLVSVSEYPDKEFVIYEKTSSSLCILLYDCAFGDVYPDDTSSSDVLNYDYSDLGFSLLFPEEWAGCVEAQEEAASLHLLPAEVRASAIPTTWQASATARPSTV